MKLGQWVKFNFNNGFKCNIGDIYVKVFRSKSSRFDRDNEIMTVLLKIDDMVNMFADYTLLMVSKETVNNYCTLSVFICKE